MDEVGRGTPAATSIEKEIANLIDAEVAELDAVDQELDAVEKEKETPPPPLPEDEFPSEESPFDDAEARASYEKARKDNPDLPSWDELSSGLELPDIPEEGWTWLEYMAMQDALSDAAAAMADPIEKEIMRYSATGWEGSYKTYEDEHGQRNTPPGLIEARAAIINGLNKAQAALTAKWIAYNKAGQPPEGGGYGGGQGNPTNPRGSGFGDGNPGDPNEPVPDPDDDLLDELAKKLGVGSAKNFVDHFIDNFIRGDGKQDENLTNLLSNKDQNWLENNLKGESAINNPKKFDNPQDAFEKLMQRAPRGIRNSIGNGAKLDLDYYKKTGDYKIDKTYVFTSTSDLEYRGIPNVKTFGGYGPSLTKPFIDAPKNYARVKMGGNVSSMINNPMQFHVIIPGPKKKKKKVNESNTFSKVKEFRNK